MKLSWPRPCRKTSASILNDQLKAELNKLYATFVIATDDAYKKAGVIAETINDLKDFINKTKNFTRNYKGGEEDAKKAQAYSDYAEKTGNLLLNSDEVPEDIKAELRTTMVQAKPAWDFYKSGQSCNATGKGPFFGGFEDCEAHAEAVIEEMAALEKAEAQITIFVDDFCDGISKAKLDAKYILGQHLHLRKKDKEYNEIVALMVKKKVEIGFISAHEDWVTQKGAFDLGRNSNGFGENYAKEVQPIINAAKSEERVNSGQVFPPRGGENALHIEIKL